MYHHAWVARLNGNLLASKKLGNLDIGKLSEPISRWLSDIDDMIDKKGMMY
ncbi:MAG: hypothetical protein GJ680_18645 [Alteromonadaceae bacterium]|nr:hypothetical protein [Alteromonadaceae bacterium]